MARRTQRAIETGRRWCLTAAMLAATACAGGAPPETVPAPVPALGDSSGATGATGATDSAADAVVALEQVLVSRARELMGRPYRLGGRGEDGGGLDCSGLIQLVYAEQGYTLPRVSRDQARAGRAVAMDLTALRPGDVLAFANGGTTVTHVGLYVGDGHFIHSARTGVRESVLSATDPDGRWYVQRWVAVRRILPEGSAAP